MRKLIEKIKINNLKGLSFYVIQIIPVFLGLFFSLVMLILYFIMVDDWIYVRQFLGGFLD